VEKQNMQQFISDSPWAGQDLIASVRTAISLRGEFQEESVLLLDESAEEKAGPDSAGAGRQHNGRLGKIEMSQVGVFLSLVKNGYHTWVDGELFLPKRWFRTGYRRKRERVGLPPDRYFQTKLELGLKMIQRVQREGLPFEAVDCDTLYGRSGWLRDELAALPVEYYADVPSNTYVYLSEPQVDWPITKRGKRAKKPLIRSPRYQVKELCHQPETDWHDITLRPNERGFLKAAFARRRVWTIRDDGSIRAEWLLIRQDEQRVTYSLSNAPVDCSLAKMASRKSQRYFIERSNQDAKSELGFDEFQALKYRAWEHHLALTIAASWFITETRLDWACEHGADPELLEHYEIDVLPALSMANVREMLRAALPLPTLSTEQAAELVLEHLDNRLRSRRSRLKKARDP
jgi:SRSO17 transposase